MSRDPLATLGLHPGCSMGEAKDYYRTLAKALHPDKNKAPGAQERFLDIKAAMDELEADPSLLGGSRSVTVRTRGAHIRMAVSVTAKHLYFGEQASAIVKRDGHCITCRGTGSSDLSLHPCPMCKGAGIVAGALMRSMTGDNQCPQCSGSGILVPEKLRCHTCHGTSLSHKVAVLKLPLGPGVIDGHVLQFREQGHAGAFKGDPGDLFVTVRVEPSEGLEYRNGRVHVWVDGTPALYVVGGELKLKILEEELAVSMPPLTGKAEAVFRNAKVLVRLNLVMPLKVSAEERALYARLLHLERPFRNESSGPLPGPPGNPDSDGFHGNKADAAAPAGKSRPRRKPKPRKRNNPGRGAPATHK